MALSTTPALSTARFPSHACTVRIAQSRDISGLLALEALFPSDAISRRQFLYHIRNPRAVFLVVRSGHSHLLGYALFLTRKDAPARFYSLIVHPEARGRGLARLLCEEGLSRLRRKKAVSVSLEVDVSDGGAIGLYESLGFRAVGVIEGYYEDGRSALKMKLSLKA